LLNLKKATKKKTLPPEQKSFMKTPRMTPPMPPNISDSFDGKIGLPENNSSKGGDL